MIPRECKRLAEVDFPIAEVSRHAAREKAIRHGHPSTLHLWWARRPLASSRAVLMGLLLPDPCDEYCPPAFKTLAREILAEVRQRPANDADLQKALLWFIGSLANWDMSSNATYVRVARNLVKAAHPEETPLVVDPFAGGGSIPLEALRVGCEAFASDLNPVACFILKVMLEDIPRRTPDLADELREAGSAIKDAAAKELVDLYPPDPDGAMPIAYLWARTVRCESPNCGAEIPLLRSLWLCKKSNRKWALRAAVARSSTAPTRVEFAIFEPESAKQVSAGTVSRARATCLCCGAVLPPDRVRAQLSAQKGGADTIFDEQGNRIGGARMTAVVTLKPGQQGRHYRLATDADYAPVRKAQERARKMLTEWSRSVGDRPCPVPDERLPPIGTLGFRVQRYGMLEWGDLFTARQKVALVAVTRGADVAGARREFMGLTVGKLMDLSNALCNWMPQQECPCAVFKFGRVKPAWDFVEGAPMGSSSGSLEVCNRNMVAGAMASRIPGGRYGQVQLADAADHPLPDETASIWFTDPPYYDAIPYADLSDAFLVWLKRAMPGHPLLRDPFDASNPLSPKEREAVQDATKECDGRAKDGEFFEDVMARSFAEGRRILGREGVGCVVFAHKTTEGWEALLSGMIRGGWTVTGSWPLATEMAHRIRARESAALETSVHLITRPRPEDAPVGDWAHVLRELPLRVTAWIERLQGEGVRGADLVFACIGPALEIYSRYRAVETAEGREVGLPEYLEKVWEVVGRAALEQVLGSNGTATAPLEEDARLTALFLWTLQSTEDPEASGRKEEDEEALVARLASKGFSLPYDVARRFAQPMGIDLDVWTDRIIEQEKGVVRLLPVLRRARALLGEDGAGALADWIESEPSGDIQRVLFPELEIVPKKKRRGRKAILGSDAELQSSDATTLDRVHAAMLLQSSGQANALRKLIAGEQERGPEFLRLANALSALYPRGSEEKRLLDAMLLGVPR